jgi:hypothetical protein
MVPLTQSDGPTNRKDIAAETPASDLTRVIGILQKPISYIRLLRTIDELARAE